jgi:hypothetical protein
LPVKDNVIMAFFDPIVDESLETISSRAHPNIVGHSSVWENQLTSPVMNCEKFWFLWFLSTCDNSSASMTRCALCAGLMS